MSDKKLLLILLGLFGCLLVVDGNLFEKWQINPFYGYNKYKVTRYNPPLTIATQEQTLLAPPPPPPSIVQPLPPPPSSYGGDTLFPPPQSAYGVYPPGFPMRSPPMAYGPGSGYPTSLPIGPSPFGPSGGYPASEFPMGGPLSQTYGPGGAEFPGLNYQSPNGYDAGNGFPIAYQSSYDPAGGFPSPQISYYASGMDGIAPSPLVGDPRGVNGGY